MLKPVQVGVSLVRHLGPGWAVNRVWHALEARTGLLERRLPRRTWDELPLAGFLRDPALAAPDAWAAHRGAATVRFLFDPADRSRYGPVLAAFDAVSSETPLARAAALLKGVVRHFEHHDLEVGWPPDWFRDPFTGGRLPADCHWHRVPTFAAGDVKCVWEASRFAFAYLLVRAYWRTGDDRFAEAFWVAVEDWCRRNPPNSGPNWKCGQEAAFRLMACLFGAWGFAEAPATTPERQALMARMAAVTAWRIEAHFGYALSQHNNHGISEAMGLWTVGTLFPEFHRAAHWEAVGRRWLERLARELIYDDGGFSQHSVNYHRVMLHDYLWCLRLGERNGRPFSETLRSRVGRAGEWLVGMLDPWSGQTPNWGSNDGALVLPLTNCTYADFRPVAQAVAGALSGRALFGPGPWDEESLWLNGTVAGGALPATASPSELSAADSGCYTLRQADGFVFVRCPHRFRHRPAHADLLHVDVWWRGVNVAQDGGSFSYNPPSPWTRGLGDAFGHNTITVDDGDQMDAVSRFIYLPWPKGTVRPARRSAGGRLVCWEGTHNGYQRLADPVTHWRALIGVDDWGWLVIDALRGRNAHRYRAHWLVADLPFVWNPDTLQLRLELAAATYWLVLGSDQPSVRWALGEDPRHPDSQWISRHYLQKERGLSVRGEGEGESVVFAALFSSRPATLDCRPGEIQVRAGLAELRLEWSGGPSGPRVTKATLRDQGVAEVCS